MDHATHNRIVSFIWNIADDVLRDVYVRGKYRDVILPMTVIRRLDVLLEATKEQVLQTKTMLDNAGIADQEYPLRHAAGQAFYNTSPFTLKTLLDNPKQLRANFTAYLDGFSKNVQEIVEKFDFRNQLRKLEQADALGYLIEKFIDPNINLSPHPLTDGNGQVKQSGLDNHGMGYVFEELIRKFNEENNEEAGEHFTPREVVGLMANLVLLPVADQIEDSTYLVYDCACGTGGMLTVAETVLKDLAEAHHKQVSIHLYGQEINPETYAISQADLLIKGEGEEADNIAFGSTLSADAFPSREFHFMLANPPYGKSWKTDLERLCGGNKKDMTDPRFIFEYNGDPEFSLVTRSSDGQLLFLVNMLDKMKSPQDSAFGSRVATVHNGSSLFTGDAGQGESNIRRWIIENDWLEAIIALPLNMFYNTGIATYIWVVTNKKPAHRRGQVQLIDATGWYHKLRKNLGQKNCELGPADIQRICDTFLAFEESEQSKIFPNEAFGYWKITVERPLRLKVCLNVDEARLKQAEKEAKLKGFAHKATAVLAQLQGKFGPAEQMDANPLLDHLTTALKAVDVSFSAKEKRTFLDLVTAKDEAAAPVIKKRSKAKRPEMTGTGPDVTGTLEVPVTSGPLYGQYIIEENGQPWRVEYEPDADLRDTEQVPLLEEDGLEGFFQRDVLPHVPDAWIDESKTAIGYEIPFTRHFYQYQPLRRLDEIIADIRALEAGTEGLLERIVASVER
jgi:type I restriction enzyme M protein